MTFNKSRQLWDDHARACDADDLLSQVRRTVNGQPVSREQIDLIVKASVERLRLQKSDVLLDLCCGNGDISNRVFDCCRGGLGVDFSPFLIEVAMRHFGGRARQFFEGDVVEYVERAEDLGRFTKLMSYGSIQYLPDEQLRRLIGAISARCVNVRRMFFGNHPDKHKLKEFFYERAYREGIEDDHETPVGKWRTREELAAILNESGWNVTFEQMPETFHNAYYRFDVVATRP